MASQFPQPAPSSGMVDRIKNIILKPSVEWDRIDAEPMTTGGIFTGWVLPLAAIGPIASLIGGQLFGYGAFGFSYKPSLVGALSTAITTYILSVVSVFVLAKIVDALAPNFGGVKNPVSALKVVAFSYTASFVAGVLGILPSLLFIAGLLGLYSLYLLYLGLPKLMKSPPDRAMGYTVVTIVCAIVLYLIVGAVVGAVTSRMAMPAFTADAGGTVSVPGGSVDLGKLGDAAKQMEAAANQATSTQAAGGKPAVDPTVLAALLPTAAAGWNRTSIESSGASAGAIGGTNAQGDYTQGSDTARLSVTDMAAIGALASLGSAFNVQSNKTTATGYEKTGTVDGRMTTEEWDNSSRHGKYSTVIASRFMVEAEGNAASMDALKALVASVDMGKLAGMAK